TAGTVFENDQFLPDHPPLGRLLLGLSHDLTSWSISGSEGTIYNVVAARIGSCAAFAVTVLLLAEFARRRDGIVSAVLTVLVLVAMPRVIGHSRLAALETMTSLAWTAAVLHLASHWTGSTSPPWKQSLIGGILFGLLLLTKVQGILLPPMIVFWALLRFRWNAVKPLMIWGLTGACVFFIGWPWLWQDPVGHTLQYLGRTTDRQTLYCWYLGTRYADKLVPWHYPFVMMLATLPLSAVVGLGARLIRRRFDAADQFLAISILGPLLVFAVPGTPVYDGTRLFLIVTPMIAVLAGRGLHLTLMWLQSLRLPSTGDTSAPRQSRCMWSLTSCAAVLICVSIFLPSVPSVISPFAMDDYGPLVGGNRGAQTLGMESGYWADALNGDFWEQVPEGSLVSVAPVSHQFQLTAMEALVPVIQQRKIRLQAFRYDSSQQRGLLLLIHRLADLRPGLQSTPAGARRVAVVTHGSVILCELVDTTDATWIETP
ncbi:MAG: glycosyltransferase family 39 protein, partial [Planctomycetaceae bacterium]|nr:glycosyltransferase family 39 protein [Planctomycetaceae bacterium]